MSSLGTLVRLLSFVFDVELNPDMSDVIGTRVYVHSTDLKTSFVGSITGCMEGKGFLVLNTDIPSPLMDSEVTMKLVTLTEDILECPTDSIEWQAAFTNSNDDEMEVEVRFLNWNCS